MPASRAGRRPLPAPRAVLTLVLALTLTACSAQGSGPTGTTAAVTTSAGPVTTPPASPTSPIGAAPPASPTSPTASPATTFTAALAPWRLPAPVSRAVALPDGKDLLLLGGLTTSGTSTADVIRVDPATGRSSRTGALVQGVHDAGGAVLGGESVIFGGGAGSVHDAVQRLGSGAGESAVVGRLPHPRADLSVATDSRGVAYLVGGAGGAGPDATILRTSDGKLFRPLADLPRPVRYAATAVSGTELWVFGGSDGSTATSAIQRVNTRTGAVAVVGHFPVFIEQAVAVVLGGTVLILGGLTDGHPSSAIWRLDPATGRVTRAGSLPVAVAMPAAVVAGRTAYLLGGEGTAVMDTVIAVRPGGGAGPQSSG
ncbi:hypothetical protein BKD30_12750 [Tersicoccus phoenicis]|uniref:Galactose oxidase n=1 Tax=Tersicoccus phoenicis TaxID=554083 RepID=A0A1R1L757_9MICC|nr:kelch repeat-containing protein [Tersicoccus phoenicis]OMH23381.1 hypothetical protein BKD30_12750 [Tersicoccus phoenicis]